MVGIGAERSAHREPCARARHRRVVSFVSWRVHFIPITGSP